KVVDNIAINGHVSLVLDKDGHPRIVFSDRTTGQLLLAQRNSSKWHVENVTGAFINPDVRPRLAIDSAGNAQVAFGDKNNTGLFHGVKRGGKWTLTRIPTRLTPGADNSGVTGLEFALHPGRLDTKSRDVGYFAYADMASRGLGFAHTGNL